MYDTDEDIAREIEDGTYFQAGRQWYSQLFHLPLAERSYFIIIIFLAIVNGYFAALSFSGVFPISPRIPFFVYSNNVWEDLPSINRIAESKGQDKNEAVMKFLVKNYVINRESYDLKWYELRYRNIWSESTKPVFDRYAVTMDAANPYGPYQLYSNKSKRLVTVDSVDYSHDSAVFHSHVIYQASVQSLINGQITSHSRWQADLTYNYSNFSVDQSLGQDVWIARFFGLTGTTLKASGEKRKVIPMKFTVTDYRVKELPD